MKKKAPHFNIIARLLHWLMACLIFFMLFIGVSMVTTISNRPWLLDLHKPIGLVILLLLIIRVSNRIFNPHPPLPVFMPLWQRILANLTHWLIYILIFFLPLTGWGMLSAGNYPVKLFMGIILPPILPQDPEWYAILRCLHSILAWSLFLVVTGHLTMALLHAFIHKDGLLTSLITGPRSENRNKN
ncbi:cytochrome b/b6 domain-containing protein [Chryseobacterium sp.]|uniref:cytochrome b n=1 Tax=Chryseobacterium sp. TaxID=1871047 RepID=UPI0025BE3AC3|nr:cytochrome b/b6 domain-containing protein [Chryseobacterium sp.]MBV8325186.1 cytochrome b [Chryseobacterium sp.]